MTENGVRLEQHLGIGLTKRAGRDLAGPCIACKSSDAFRLHRVTGVGHCYSCKGKWAPFQIAEAVLQDRDRAKSVMIELGFWESQNESAGSEDPITVIARQKHVSAESLRAYGAKAVSSTEIELPAFGPDGQACTTFKLSTRNSKGLFKKGKKAGLFFPHVDGVARLPMPGETWYLVEGVKDAAALYALGYLACGLNTSSMAPKFCRLFRSINIVIVPDRDRPGEDGAQNSARCLHGVASSISISTLPAEFKETKGEDVRDILGREGGQELIHQALADAQPWVPVAAEGDDPQGRVVIEVTTDEHRVNDEIVSALARDRSLYQRGGALVQIQLDHAPKVLKSIHRPQNAPRIVIVKEATLREHLTLVADFLKRKATKDGFELSPIHPPAFCVSAVASRGHWPSVRHLEGVINSPILRRNGTILQTPGYDRESAIYYEPIGAQVRVSENPNREDALVALGELLEVVVDFPFASKAHLAAWVAFLLTPLARHAFQGPAPLFLIDANVRGSGKTLLADAASIIVTGRSIARTSYPESDEELRKRITAIVLAGDQMLLFDNIAGDLGSPSLDAALTGSMWKDRVLGKSEIVEMPLVTTWAATGNNMMLRADTSRRVCHIRLNSNFENPETREGFRHENLLRWVRENRPRLLGAALTILAAHAQAGRPSQGLKAWGSFEGWSEVVREALVWIGLPDPAQTREQLAQASDREASALRALIEGWHELDANGTGYTASGLIELLNKRPSEFELVRGAVLELCSAPSGKLPGAKSLGSKLRHLRGRVVNGKALDSRDKHGTAVWFVADVVQNSAKSCNHAQANVDGGCSGCSGCSVSSRSDGESPGEGPGAANSKWAKTEQPEQPEQPPSDLLFPAAQPNSMQFGANLAPWNEDRY